LYDRREGCSKPLASAEDDRKYKSVTAFVPGKFLTEEDGEKPVSVFLETSVLEDHTNRASERVDIISISTVDVTVRYRVWQSSSPHCWTFLWLGQQNIHFIYTRLNRI